jgi:arabinose-5-phosphate isomerase
MQPTSIPEIAQRTLNLEAQALLELSASIDDRFVKTIHLLREMKGRLVISGIGKSAIVGQKIVATLNSTGTPSVFMHAADAIHGDLGMIQQNDVVMIISKSGESPEIKILITLIKNLGNPLIGMVGNLQSILAKSSNYILNATVSQEACPNNLAPTASTTAQMAMGDAMAVSLMELKGFTANDFAKFHPGGTLGKKLYLRVNDLSALNEKPQVGPESTIKEVIVEMTRKRLGLTAVVDSSSKLVGVITDGDLRRMLEKDLDIEHKMAKEIMGKDPKTIAPDALAVDALDKMRKNNITQLIVKTGEEYTGVIHLHDLLREGIV